MTADLKDELRRKAADLGFDGVRVTTPGAIGAAGERLADFIVAGRHGDMHWMQTTADRRAHPSVLWPQARSVIMLAMSYAPATDPLDALDDPHRGVVSVYAKGKDYHDVLKGRIKQLAADFARTSGAEVKVFVDTAPVMEKPLAAAAGLGWQGKHTNLVSREHGSWLFLGAIMTTAELEPDAPEVDHCGSCRRCLDVCPTDAFPAPYVMDARRCLAYLTIEHKGHIPEPFRVPMGNRVFGCDDCLAVCPWNKFAQAAREARFAARAETDNPPLGELLALDDRSFRARFAGTPVKRTGRDRFVRNVLIAAGNSGDAELLPQVEALLGDESPLVRAMAIWAMRRLTRDEVGPQQRRRHLAREGDESVRAEWQRTSTS
jgi:epoxyqueuosine reductase